MLHVNHPHRLHPIVERLTSFLVIYSVIMFFVEVEHHGMDAPSTGFFLWSERFCALFFTTEYLARWYRHTQYPRTLCGLIDLIGFLPFWIGFFLPIEHLKWVRALRVLRLLKFHRYNGALQRFDDVVMKVKEELSLLGYFSVMVIVFGSIIMYAIERDAKDTKFTSLFDSVWWCVVTLSTIGYGDIYPVTFWGKIVAIVIIICGVGIFGTLISLLGSGLVQVYRDERIAQEKANEAKVPPPHDDDSGRLQQDQLSSVP